ncbi:MAG: N-acyl-D-amino-acid deacylase family protein [Acidimicrobiales bacterium]
MTFDLLVRDGHVVDGSGQSGFQADVAVSNGKVVAVEPGISGTATRVIDAQGRIVAPGFIDIHTHFDAQILWDPPLASTVRHGITSVVAGNCGFTVSPVSPGDGDFIIQMLARVEGMPADALKTGLNWEWESFGEYVDRLRSRVGVNYLPQIGHSTLRRYAMGDAAFERAATDEEVATMRRLLVEAVRAGARGFSTSTSATHNDSFGRPVPSRLAEKEEFLSLAEALRGSRHPLIGISPGSKFVGINADERSLMVEMATRSGAVVHWNPLVYSAAYPDLHARTLEVSDEARAAGARVVGVYNPGPPGPTRVDLRSGFLFESLPHWKEILRLSIDERCEAMKQAEVRRNLKADFDDDSTMGHLTAHLRQMWPVLTVATVSSEANRKYLGRTVGSIAAEEGSDPMDTMLDIAVRDHLDTVFMNDNVTPSDAAANEAMQALTHHPDVVFGGSDAGAHLDFMSNEPLPSRALALRVREQGVLSLEEVVHGFTGRLAEVFGLEGRGVLAPGMAADICVFDLEEIGAGMPYMVNDLPAKSERFVTEPLGIYQTIVNGVIVSDEGEATGTLAGQVL